MKQLSLDLQTTENIDPYLEENFLILKENSASFNSLEKFFSQKNYSNSKLQSLILNGQKASGKTHLLHIFAKKSSAKFLKISDKNFKANHFYILENIDKIKNEEALLHLINSASEAKAFLVLSSTDKANFKLKDLTSRLKNIFTLTIKEPSLETIEMLLINGFGRRQIKVSSQMINSIAKNISRNYQAILDVIIAVESYCQDSGKNITMTQLNKILLLKS